MISSIASNHMDLSCIEEVIGLSKKLSVITGSNGYRLAVLLLTLHVIFNHFYFII